MNKSKYLQLFLVLFFSVHCTMVPTRGTPDRQPNLALAPAAFPEQKKINVEKSDWLKDLPGLAKEYQAQVKWQIKRNKKNSLSEAEFNFASERIAKYVSFIMHNYPNSLIKKKVSDRLIARLFESSTQFILCPDLEDFSCLEKAPLLSPSLTYRIEDPKLKLGEAVEINDALDKNLDLYFNEQIFTPEDQFNSSIGIARKLEEKIKNLGTDPQKNSLHMAIYGMDDIQKTEQTPGSLLGTYSAITERIEAGTPVFGVFDQSGAHPTAQKPLIFSYVKPVGDKEKNWILSPLQMAYNPHFIGPQVAKPNLTNMNFQYNSGTQGLIQKLSENITTEDESRGRIEWRNHGIMHNKFFIFKENNNFSVWTGTANISRTCLGTERNSNMSILLRNNEVAQSFMAEFNEMFQFQDPKNVKPEIQRDFIGGQSSSYFPRGRFHGEKTPNTKRYFKFLKDQSDLRLYFSPTDDAEHRALLPMLYSARAGDQILISMFGGAGIEYVRAIQWASAIGVDIKVLVDSPTACGPGSWAGRAGNATLLELNPYRDLFPKVKQIEIRKNDKGSGETWKQNHQKVGLLLRRQNDGHLNPEYLTLGSQNWSESGNDKNDENLLIFRRTQGPVPAGAEFQKHFETFLWPKSLNIPPTGCADVLPTAEE